MWAGIGDVPPGRKPEPRDRAAVVEKRSFRVPIQHASGGGAYVDIPFDVEEAFGKKRVPVRAWIDGEPCRGTLVRMGSESHVLIAEADPSAHRKGSG
jgi:hypothetical protein